MEERQRGGKGEDVCVCVCVAMGERRVRVDLTDGLFSITEPLFVAGVMLLHLIIHGGLSNREYYLHTKVH